MHENNPDAEISRNIKIQKWERPYQQTLTNTGNHTGFRTFK